MADELSTISQTNNNHNVKKTEELTCKLEKEKVHIKFT